MNGKNEDLINKIDEFDNSKVKIQKTYHSSFSTNNVFDASKTFTSFDMKKYGAFHGACDIEGSDVGKKIAENRVFVKILEDANKMKGLSPQTRMEVIRENDIDFKKLEELTGYKVSGVFENPIMTEIDVTYTRAIELNENRTGQWNPYDIIREVMGKFERGEVVDGITEDDLDAYYTDSLSFDGVLFDDLYSSPYGGEELNQDYKEFLFVRDWLESKGYDAIKYKNTFEGSGDCIMSLKEENVKVTNSYCLKHLFDGQEKPKEKKKSKNKISR